MFITSKVTEMPIYLTYAKGELKSNKHHDQGNHFHIITIYKLTTY